MRKDWDKIIKNYTEKVQEAMKNHQISSSDELEECCNNPKNTYQYDFFDLNMFQKKIWQYFMNSKDKLDEGFAMIEALIMRGTSEADKFVCESCLKAVNNVIEGFAKYVFSEKWEHFQKIGNANWLENFRIKNSKFLIYTSLNILEFSDPNFEKEKEEEKYENPPTSDQANPILFSMTRSFEEMKKLLEHFPSSTDKKQMFLLYGPFQKARACTLAFSGQLGYNCRIKPWRGNDLQIGIVIDHHKVDIPYGDMTAYKSNDMILDGSNVTKKDDTKYGEKEQYNRPWIRDESAVKKTLTNQAKLIKLPNNEFKNLKEGSIEAFGGNVWRKYFKNKNTATNEALCLQKKDGENPIVGIFLNIRLGLSGGIIKSSYPDISRYKDQQNLFNILEKNSQLKLYVYDVRQKEHIVRVVENEKARELISLRCDFNQDFVATLTPYQGFQDQQLATPQSAISATESKNIKTPDPHEKNEKNSR